MPEGNIYLLTERQRAYFQKIRAAIFAELHKEGIDTDTSFSVAEETLQRIAQRLQEKPAKINARAAYKKAHKALSERSFMIMRADLRLATLEDFAHLYRIGTGTLTAETTETPEEHAAFLDTLRKQLEKERRFYSNGKQDSRAMYREWFFLRSDHPSLFQTPQLSPIWPGSPAYQLLAALDDWKSDHTIRDGKKVWITDEIRAENPGFWGKKWDFTPSPDQLEDLRNALGLSNYRYVDLGDYTELLFLDSFLNAAIAALQEAQETAEQGLIAGEAPKVFASPTDTLSLPLDKVNSNIWRMISQQKENGQIGVDLEAVTSKKGSRKEAVVYAGISFDEEDGMRITRQIDPYDKRVYIAVGGLFNGGNAIFSASQIYRAMGNDGQPSSADVQRINASLDKMGTARLYVDSTQETTVNKGYKSFKYDAPLLPFERMTAYIDNTLCEVAIHLFREPPLITFAKERKQITQIPRNLLTSPISKTNANLTLEDYLLDRIGRMKSPKSNANRKINLSTIFDKCRITTTKQKQRTPAKVKTYLEHYKKTGWIKGYTEDKEGFLIVV